MIAALFAMATAFMVTGWIAARTSRRVARLWAALALVGLAGANALEIVNVPGPWWPYRHLSASAGEAIALVLWICALALVLRARQRGFQAGLVILACGVAAFAFGLGAGVIGKSASERGRICPGAPASLHDWTATLRAVQPVVGADYTGVAARVELGFDDGDVVTARPERRDYFTQGPGPLAGSRTLVRWNGELLVQSVANRNSPECAELVLEWQPYAQWLRYGAWLSLAGALVLLVAALRVAAWRAGARGRIAMRREDRGRAPLPTISFGMGWKPVMLALACGIIVFAWQTVQQVPHDPPQHRPVNGVALIAARQAEFGGPHLGNRWLVIADALARHGQFGEAAQVLLGATEKEPRNAEAWLALGDALYGHAGGRVVAAAELAYDRADRMAAPQASARSVVASALAASGRESAAAEWLCRDYLPYRQCPD
jgi:Cytochrome c-type biogenesis protein CcmF C-terminal/Tetratricopeptide repeat